MVLEEFLEYVFFLYFTCPSTTTTTRACYAELARYPGGGLESTYRQPPLPPLPTPPPPLPPPPPPLSPPPPPPRLLLLLLVLLLQIQNRNLNPKSNLIDQSKSKSKSKPSIQFSDRMEKVEIIPIKSYELEISKSRRFSYEFENFPLDQLLKKWGAKKQWGKKKGGGG